MALKTSTQPVLRLTQPAITLRLPTYQLNALKWAALLEEGGELPNNVRGFLPEENAPRATKAVSK